MKTYQSNLLLFVDANLLHNKNLSLKNFMCIISHTICFIILQQVQELNIEPLQVADD